MNTNLPEKEKGEWLPYLKNPIIISIIVTMLLLPFLKPLITHIPEPPPVLTELPDFQLVDESGKPFTKTNLIGNVHIVGFFFTRCKGICPFTIEAMKQLSNRFLEVKIPIRFLAISVDPDYDTPSVLMSYAKQKEIDLKHWQFLTGERGPLVGLIEGGFQLSAGERIVDKKDLIDVSHTSKLALLDANGAVRGYFDTSKDGLDEVFHRSQHVLFSMAQKKN